MFENVPRASLRIAATPAAKYRYLHVFDQAYRSIEAQSSRETAKSGFDLVLHSLPSELLALVAPRYLKVHEA